MEIIKNRNKNLLKLYKNYHLNQKCDIILLEFFLGIKD